MNDLRPSLQVVYTGLYCQGICTRTEYCSTTQYGVLLSTEYSKSTVSASSASLLLFFSARMKKIICYTLSRVLQYVVQQYSINKYSIITSIPLARAPPRAALAARQRPLLQARRDEDVRVRLEMLVYGVGHRQLLAVLEADLGGHAELLPALEILANTSKRTRSR